MIKKHLITCSLMLAVCIAAQFLIYSSVSPLRNLISIQAEEVTEEIQADPYYYPLSFANEAVPLGDERITKKINTTLKAFSHKKLRTSKLHVQASKWFPVIEPILKQYGIPEDFKYVPLVESGLQGGTSPKGASGFWQFMPQTARGYGLKVEGNIDERQNMRKSTHAAAKYILSLYKEFNSWTLAAAAYNIGGGSLKRHIDKQNQDNYFKMKLNRETASYVYKLISMKEIIENPLRYGYKSKSSQLLAKSDPAPKHDFNFIEKSPIHRLIPRAIKN